ncbi:hypothetical protein MHK_003611, partial [Candidatus Magnetomorum sp. HK-1]
SYWLKEDLIPQEIPFSLLPPVSLNVIFQLNESKGMGVLRKKQNFDTRPHSHLLLTVMIMLLAKILKRVLAITEYYQIGE